LRYFILRRGLRILVWDWSRRWKSFWNWRTRKRRNL